MTPADATDVAKVHVAAWKETYRGIMPQRVLDSLSIADRASALHRRLRRVSPVHYFVAEINNEIVGFAIIGPSRDEDSSNDDAELMAIYVHPAAQRRGAGQALLSKAKAAAKQLGCRRLVLWVLKNNSAGRTFFRHNGMRQESTRGTYKIAGESLVKMRYSCPIETER
ncbi:MAG: GNAT family N-acetyltransferase [Bowdeniella nasicola]|nr:GNAT family N-acetyltransferase [Bowdeniella nasicola]